VVFVYLLIVVTTDINVSFDFIVLAEVRWSQHAGCILFSTVLQLRARCDRDGIKSATSLGVFVSIWSTTLIIRFYTADKLLIINIYTYCIIFYILLYIVAFIGRHRHYCHFVLLLLLLLYSFADTGIFFIIQNKLLLLYNLPLFINLLCEWCSTYYCLLTVVKAPFYYTLIEGRTQHQNIR